MASHQLRSFERSCHASSRAEDHHGDTLSEHRTNHKWRSIAFTKIYQVIN